MALSIRTAIPRACLSFLLLAGCPGIADAIPGQIDISRSAGFGESVHVLPNRNVVVVDTGFQSNTGAVYLLRADGSLISELRGRAAGDRIGSGGILVLDSGHFVVLSPNWQSPLADVGAVTWVDGSNGRNGVVEPANSLTGSTSGDRVGERGLALKNGQYLIASPHWHNGAIAGAGAITLVSGPGAVTGLVSIANSIVGLAAGDQIGSGDQAALPTGDAVVASPNWSSQRGAVTQIRHTALSTGSVTAANSLVGTSAGDAVGAATPGRGITVLRNGNYVVCSPAWSNTDLGISYVGAATWSSAASPRVGPVSAANSLTGTELLLRICSGGVTALANGHYVVGSPNWHGAGQSDVGAATWGNGLSGSAGQVTAANSLVGALSNDRVGESVSALSDGSYAVVSPMWSTPTLAAVGAVTWRGGGGSAPGVVSEGNSLTGGSQDDHIGSGGVVALAGGAYAVASPSYQNGLMVQAGAVTRLPGGVFYAGIVSGGNSLVGTLAEARVGTAITALANGHFAVASPNWQYVAPGPQWFGALTWFDGTLPTSGSVNTGNSVIGATGHDQLGNGGLAALPDGSFLAYSPDVDANGFTNASALCRYSGTGAISGGPSSAYCVFGQSVSASAVAWKWDHRAGLVAIGRPSEGIVTLLPPPDVLFADSFDP